MFTPKIGEMILFGEMGWFNHQEGYRVNTADQSNQAAEKLDETAVTQACLEFLDVWKTDKNLGKQGVCPFRMGRDLELPLAFLFECMLVTFPI